MKNETPAINPEKAEKWRLLNKVFAQIQVFGNEYVRTKALQITEKRDPSNPNAVILAQLNADELERLLLSIGIRPELIAEDQSKGGPRP